MRNMGIPQIFTLSPLTQDDWEQFGSIHTKKKRTKYLIYKYLVLFSCTLDRSILEPIFRGLG